MCSLSEYILRQHKEMFAESDEWLYKSSCVKSPYMEMITCTLI